MGKIGYGYGSEFHLLRWMGRHRDEFDAAVLEALGETKTQIRWLDFKFTSAGKDSEWKGIDFIRAETGTKHKWASFWPNKSGIHNWDAVGILEISTGPEWILAEAKAHAKEIQSDCQAKDPDSLAKIRKALGETKLALGGDRGRDWTKGCYQFTNRLAALWFLHQNNIPSRLLFIYFTGDKRPVRNNPDWNPECPINKAAWEKILNKQAELVGLPEKHPLSGQIHKLFLPAFVTEAEG